MFSPTLIKKIKQADLLGRGCGTFPVAKKWEIVRQAKGKTKYVICNISESEPGIFKDQFILDNYPEKVLDGVALAMRTLKAKQGFIYVNPTYYTRFKNKLQILIEDDNIEIFSKPAQDYIGGEESALINLMEGQREEPRIRPPYITQQGFLGCPTLVNNCETFYTVSLINNDQYKNEKFFCISGENTPQAVFNFHEKTTIYQALIKSGHYPSFPFFIQLGGAAAGVCLREDQLDKYTIQNYSGLIVYKLATPEKELISKWLSFFKSESCGQCVSCREGIYRLHEVYNTPSPDLNLLSDIIFTMRHASLCSFGSMATQAIVSYFKNIKHQPIKNIDLDSSI